MFGRESNGYLVLFFWIVFLVFGIYLFKFSYYQDVKTLGINFEMPEESFGFSNSYFYTFLEKIGEAGQTSYFNFQVLDYINLFLFGFVLLITVLHFLGKLKATKFLNFLVLLPILYVLSDFFENTLIIYLLMKLPSKFDSIAELISDLTKLKLFFGGLSFLSLLIFGLALLLQIFGMRFRKNLKD